MNLSPWKCWRLHFGIFPVVTYSGLATLGSFMLNQFPKGSLKTASTP